MCFLLHGQAGDDKRVLAWRIRYRVALGVAEALDYLQNGCRLPVIHRDVKPSNVLLTENFEPRVNCQLHVPSKLIHTSTT